MTTLWWKKLRNRWVKSVAQGHTTCKCWMQDFTPGHLAESLPFNHNTIGKWIDYHPATLKDILRLPHRGSEFGPYLWTFNQKDAKKAQSLRSHTHPPGDLGSDIPNNFLKKLKCQSRPLMPVFQELTVSFIFLTKDTLCFQMGDKSGNSGVLILHSPLSLGLKQQIGKSKESRQSINKMMPTHGC